MRFLGHHDLLRLLQRALRRTGLPIRYTEGFTPRPILSFPLALSLGVESEAEILELELTRSVPAGEVQDRLGEQMPGEGDIAVMRVEPFDRRHPARIESVEYRFELEDAPADLPERIDGLLAREEIRVDRRTGKGARNVDLRPWIESIEFESGTLTARVRVTGEGTVRPAEVPAVLEIPVESIRRTVKIRTHLKKENAREGTDAH